ncbi:hypothetical protein RND71_023437 [Anisodus tanguticus]|uniref:Uncharacterized protein n=1 Tax=Anisodus tanguticus TaxID=243964 RepID=A0AAE1RVI9_9SOLA|nr:hypothetical protein RND71_023437 [Anisodus tanguticus]
MSIPLYYAPDRSVFHSPANSPPPNLSKFILQRSLTPYVSGFHSPANSLPPDLSAFFGDREREEDGSFFAIDSKFSSEVENMLDTTIGSLGPDTRNKVNFLGKQASQVSSASVHVFELQSSKGEKFFPTELEEGENIVEIVEKTLVHLSPFQTKNPSIQDDNDALITRSAPITLH